MIIFKKYSNRKIYGKHEGKYGYVTISQIISFIKQGEEIQVVEHATGEDVTSDILKGAVSQLSIPNDVLISIIQDGRYE
jgi:polyhydroxyalkanoate synthesis regulator protein